MAPSLFLPSLLGFVVLHNPVARSHQPQTHKTRVLRHPTAVVIDISSAAEFDEALKTAGDSLVVVDYSTSWCGPCKIIAPKFDEFSEKYTNVAFLKVSNTHTQLLRRKLVVALSPASRRAHKPQ